MSGKTYTDAERAAILKSVEAALAGEQPDDGPSPMDRIKDKIFGPSNQQIMEAMHGSQKAAREKDAKKVAINAERLRQLVRQLPVFKGKHDPQVKRDVFIDPHGSAIDLKNDKEVEDYINFMVDPLLSGPDDEWFCNDEGGCSTDAQILTEREPEQLGAPGAPRMRLSPMRLNYKKGPFDENFRKKKLTLKDVLGYDPYDDGR